LVVGIDPSPEMLELARARCAGLSNVAFREGEAVTLPAEAEEFDAALSIQVLEYVDDVGRALSELHRVLRPGGRLVLWDVDWSTLSWHSRDPERMRRALLAWDAHLADPVLPHTLAARLAAAGFEDVDIDGHAFVMTDLSPDRYVGALFGLIADYLASSSDLAAGEAEEWASEQRELSDRGEFFFACLQFRFGATKAGRHRPTQPA
jgi:SAM-dependent methyltransferase